MHDHSSRSLLPPSSHAKKKARTKPDGKRRKPNLPCFSAQVSLPAVQLTSVILHHFYSYSFACM